MCLGLNLDFSLHKSIMARKFGDKLDELDLSQEEIDRLSNCMKDEKFRDLLKEYAEEISDPANRKRYEEEIAMLERDRGVDVKFINPKPGHVLKTSVDGEQKCFVNICTNENLGQPRSSPSVQGTTRGMQWSIPHSVSQAREDVDKAGKKCMVYDVVFHPDTYHMLTKNARFKKMIHDTALDAVERQFGVTLDKVNVKTPKMTFKGLPVSSVIRTPHGNNSEGNDSSNEDDVKLKVPYPPPPDVCFNNGTDPKPTKNNKPYPNFKEEAKRITQSKEALSKKNKTISSKTNSDKTEGTPDEGFVEPKYTIVHRGYFDMQDYCGESNGVGDTRPRQLLVNIDLPMLSAANSLNLEVFERRLYLESVKPAKYKLDFELPYPVDENKGFAKFCKSKRRLTITLEVLPAPPTPKLLPFMNPVRVCEAPVESNSNGVDSVCKHKTNAETPVQNEAKESNSVQISKVESSNAQCCKDTDSKNVQQLQPCTNASNGTSSPPTFVEEGRRHYQQGSKWKDNDDASSVDLSVDSTKLSPLSKSSAFLIDMVMKYEGLIRRCPKYSFLQDEHYVTFVIGVPQIFEESLWYAVYDNMLQFCCLSECLDNDMVNSVFQLWIEFGPGCLIDPTKSRVDVSGSNAVFCLRKFHPGKEWQNIRAGFDKDTLQHRLFSTKKNVCDLYTLVYDHSKDVDVCQFAVCEIAKAEKELLILRLKPKEQKTNTSGDSKCNGIEHKTAQNGLSDRSQGAKVDAQAKEELNRGDLINKKKVEKNKTVTFSDKVHENISRKEAIDNTDSDDDDDDGPTNTINKNNDLLSSSAPIHTKEKPASGLITVRNSDGTISETIIDHTTKSAVTLSTTDLLYELDDDM